MADHPIALRQERLGRDVWPELDCPQTQRLLYDLRTDQASKFAPHRKDLGQHPLQHIKRDRAGADVDEHIAPPGLWLKAGL